MMYKLVLLGFISFCVQFVLWLLYASLTVSGFSDGNYLPLFFVIQAVCGAVMLCGMIGELVKHLWQKDF